MKNKRYLSFLIPFCIFILIGISTGIFLVKGQNILITDLSHQYVSLLTYYKNVFNGTESLFYSFSKGLGGNMLGTYAYYLASPLNLILLLFSKQNLYYGIFLIISIKIGLSGLAMYYFLSENNKVKDYALLIFSTSYALMGFNVVYFFNLMWLDIIYLTPLLLVGINKIINKESSLFYGIVLFISIFTNYYMAFILCVFACLYFVYKLLTKYSFAKNFGEVIIVILKFTITSLLAGLMTSILLLPTIYDLVMNVSRNLPYALERFSGAFGMLFSRLTIGAHNYENILNKETPAIYSGLIMLPLVYFYFVNKNIETKYKVLSFMLLLVLIVGIYIPFINVLWHGNSLPNSFNYRFSYLISLLIILLAYKSFAQIKEVELKQYLIFLAFYLFMSILVIIQGFKHINNLLILLSALLMLFYLILLYFYNKVDDREKTIIKKLMILLVLSELFFNFQLSINKYEFRYNNEYKAYVTTFNEKIESVKPSEKDFYRIEKEQFYTMIDPMFFNYNGASTFISTLNKRTSIFYNNINFQVSTNKVNYNFGASPIMDSILGIRYLFGDDLNYNKYDEFKFSRYKGMLFDLKKKNIIIYQNPNALSLGFMVDKDVNNFVEYFKQGKIRNSFETQNYFIKTMINKDVNIFKPYKIKKIDNKNYEILIDNRGPIYLSIYNSFKDDIKYKVSVYIDDEFIKTFEYYDHGILKINNKYKDELIKLNFQTKEDIYGIFLYYLDEELLTDAISELQKNQMNITSVNKHHIKGNINVTDDKTVLFTSIPYEEGWTVLVDGKEMNYYSVFDMFIGLDLTEGYHEIEFKFMPPYFKLGIFISIISVILFAIYIFFERNITNFVLSLYNKYEEIINYLIAGGLTTVVSISSYALFSKLLCINYIISTILSFVLAVIFAYFVNKKFVFKSITNNLNELLIEMYQFIKYRLISLGIDVLLMILMVSVLNIDDLISKIIVQVIIVILNYFFSKIFIFK